MSAESKKSETTADAKQATVTKIVQPIKPTDYGLMIHRVRSLDCLVDPSLRDELENERLWYHMASMIEKAGDEVRVLADDMSFVARLIVVFKSGNVVKMRVESLTDLDKVDAHPREFDRFEAKLRGPRKWCVIDKMSGDIIRELIPTQSEAIREIEELVKQLS